MLAQLHPHPRDACITFDPGPHKYTIRTSTSTCEHSNYVSVTTWNHSHFPTFDPDAVLAKMNLLNPKSPYFGQTKEEIKAGWETNRATAAALGTAMHAQIEDYYNNGGSINREDTTTTTTKEMQLFYDFVQANPHLQPYRSEWMIFHEEWRLAGAVDMVFQNTNDGTFAIYDWKRSKSIQKTNAYNQWALTECIAHLPDANYWHYALQLNTYKAILEAKYGLQISELCLVILHPNQSRFLVQKVPVLALEMHELLCGLTH